MFRIMAVSHIFARLLVFMVFSIFLLRFRSFHRFQGRLKANTQILLRSFWFVRHQPCASRVKLPIVKWSKHGRTVIVLQEIKQSTGRNLILQCDVQHQPRSYTSNSDTREDRTRTTKLTSSETLVTIAHLNVCLMVLCENFPLITQTIS